MEQKNQKTKIIKILLITILILVIISIVATIAIGNYFVDYAILRTGKGGDREVKWVSFRTKFCSINRYVFFKPRI